MEMLDIFDKNYIHIGTSSKEDVHKLGLWHQVAGCIFLDSTENTILFQYKNASHNEVAHQNKIDLSVGGHILAGETIQNGIIREIKEESSLDILPEELDYIGYKTTNVDATPTYKIREFCHIFFLDKKFNLEELHSIDDEVLYYISFNIDELQDFILNKKESIIGNTPNGQQEFNINQFIKGYLDDRIYEMVLILAQNYIKINKSKQKLQLTP